MLRSEVANELGKVTFGAHLAMTMPYEEQDLPLYIMICFLVAKYENCD
jgi:hypothetical protein